MKSWHVILAAFGLGAVLYIGLQTQSGGAGTTGLLTLGLKNNPRYVQLGLFALFVAGALLYYDSFSRK